MVAIMSTCILTPPPREALVYYRIRPTIETFRFRVDRRPANRENRRRLTKNVTANEQSTTLGKELRGNGAWELFWPTEGGSVKMLTHLRRPTSPDEPNLVVAMKSREKWPPRPRRTTQHQRYLLSDNLADSIVGHGLHTLCAQQWL